MVVWQVLMVTSNRVLQLGSGLGTGSWTVEWELQFDKIQGPPSVLQVRISSIFFLIFVSLYFSLPDPDVSMCVTLCRCTISMSRCANFIVQVCYFLCRFAISCVGVLFPVHVCCYSVQLCYFPFRRAISCVGVPFPISTWIYIILFFTMTFRLNYTSHGSESLPLLAVRL